MNLHSALSTALLASALLRIVLGVPGRPDALLAGVAGRRWQRKGAGCRLVASSIVKSRIRFWALSWFPLVVVWSLVVALGGGVVSLPLPLCERRPWWLEFVGIGAGAVSYNKAAGVLILAG